MWTQEPDEERCQNCDHRCRQGRGCPMRKADEHKGLVGIVNGVIVSLVLWALILMAIYGSLR